MLLALDIGNTEITIGLFDEDEIVARWRLTTQHDRTPDEWASTLASLLQQSGYGTKDIRGVIYASVAPAVTQSLAQATTMLTHLPAVAVDARSTLPITLDVDEPQTVGADRIVNTLAAKVLFGTDTIVVDFGTATTFDCITADGKFIGGVIMPGFRTSADQLTRKAAKLPATELTPPGRAIGRRTEECIRSGVLFGTADSVDGLLRRIIAEWPGGKTPRIVATGGLAGMIAPLTQLVKEVAPDLTLQGLRIAAAHLKVGA